MEQSLPFRKQRLFCPGPTPIPLKIQLLNAGENPYHRSEFFYEKFLNCRKLLAKVMGSKNLPIILSSSGSGAMEAAVTNFTELGDKVLTLNGGKFGARWTKITEAYQCETKELSFPWGESIPKKKLENILISEQDLKAVFLQANETSTGVSYPLAEITQIIKKHSKALIVVDAISALGAEAIEMDKNQIDILISGSQKGLSTAPGLSFINVTDRSWKEISNRPRFYFDLESEMKSQEKGRSAFTPASTLITMLEQNLLDMTSFGLEKIYKSNMDCAESARSAFKAMGLKLFARSHPSSTVTSVLLPEEIDGKLLLKDLKQKYSVVYAGGQGDYESKLLRFAHMGHWDLGDLAVGFLALESCLNLQGFHCKKGSGVQSFWHEYNSRYL